MKHRLLKQAALESAEGMWTFINSLGVEEGPYTVWELRQMLYKCDTTQTETCRTLPGYYS